MLDRWACYLAFTVTLGACGPGDHQTTCSNGDIAAVIVASDYDQTCQTDADCVVIAVDFCNGCPWCSDTEAINNTSKQQYFDDLKSRDGVLYDVCRCPGPRVPCCVFGKCQVSNACATNP